MILVRCVRPSLDDEAMGPSGMASKVVVGRKDEVDEDGEGGSEGMLMSKSSKGFDR